MSATILRVVLATLLGLALVASGWFLWRWQAEAQAPSTVVSANAINHSPSHLVAPTSATASDPPIRAESERTDAEATAASTDERWKLAVVDALIKQDEAAALVVAALLSGSTELAERASKVAPGDTTIQWLAYSACRSIAAARRRCDAKAFANALRAADPDNALHLLDELERAVAAGDRQAELAAIAEIAKKKRFDNYYAASERMIFNTLASVRLPAPTMGTSGASPVESLASGVSAALWLPPLASLAEACKRLSEGLSIEHCRQASSIMRQSDSYIVRAVGLNIGERAVNFGSSEASEIIAERRQLEWMAYQISRSPPMSPTSLTPSDVQRLLVEADGEIQVWQAWMREHGIPLDPPADWSRP